jgi:hypothetical protein
MNEENIVSLSLAYYDTKKRDHQQYYSADHRLELHEDGNDTSLPTYELIRSNKVVNAGVYNILGVYFKEEKQWTWGWMVNERTKIATYLCRQILNYALDIVFEESVKSNPQTFKLMIKNDLMNPFITIEHPVQLEQYLAMGQYLTNSDMVYKVDNHPMFGSNVTVYTILKYSDL